MNFRILIPFWGRDERYVRLLGNWYTQYRSLRLPHPVTVITDFDTDPVVPSAWVRSFPVASKNQYQFDHKGNIVCAAITAFHEPLLVLDSDAVLQGDPEPLLRPFEKVPFSLPKDEGALGRKIRNRHAQEGPIVKGCAGVLWFGASQDRQYLVDEYRLAFRELCSGRYYEERRLFEQHAWTMVRYKLGSEFLPRLLNWPDHITSVGHNPDAVICHHIGQRKFRT